jgi:hypothetical protein
MDGADDTVPWPLQERHADSGWSDSLMDAHAASVLSPDMLDALRRLATDGGSELLEVVALCLRLKEPMLLTIAVGGWAWPITLYPEHGLYRAPIDWTRAPPQDLARARLLDCEPALLAPPRLAGRQRGTPPNHYPLAGLTWTLALLGPRTTPLRMLARTERFRTTMRTTPPAATHEAAEPGWRLPGALGSAVARLAGSSASLGEVARWPGLDRARASRLLNGLFLDERLILIDAPAQRGDTASAWSDTVSDPVASRWPLWARMARRSPGGRYAEHWLS